MQPMSYIMQQMEQGFSLEFIAKDAGVKPESLIRRLYRALQKDTLSKNHIAILHRWVRELDE